MALTRRIYSRAARGTSPLTRKILEWHRPHRR